MGLLLSSLVEILLYFSYPRADFTLGSLLNTAGKLDVGYNMSMQAYDWYQQLIKPSWAPPAAVFGPVWTILYIGIFVSFGAVFIMAAQKKIAWIVVLPFVLNLLFNVAFTPLQFGLKSNLLASIDILLVLATLLWAMRSIFPFAPWIMYAQIPYLLWVAFATALQLTITFINLK